MPAGAWILRRPGYLYLRESVLCIDIDNNSIKTNKECINMFIYEEGTDAVRRLNSSFGILL